ncbi:hypothetical protein CFIMG_002319RA [Ceratocystis fimbriata CBS 114723]|uniref:Solute carrier family 25 member 45 n=1 Tax=Ceratocystis fimbriata CBS 114723 TaxID=1035309 RepID=A0A2C5X4S6_9PEZI|nr:hypothetical protein CFIMG_002319RA [Ceratocystis fimbriata CBS 114723]
MKGPRDDVPLFMANISTPPISASSLEGLPNDGSLGLLPVLPDGPEASQKQKKRNAATAASAASVRALSAQAIAFYFRAPAKAFFRMRVDYLAFARRLHQAEAETLRNALHATSQQATGNASAMSGPLVRAWHHALVWMHGTTPGVLASAVRQQGWGIIPHQVVPPLAANVGVGAVLYTSYLHILGLLHEESGRGTKHVYPPPRPVHTFEAGFLAGALQSVVAAPLDAIQARYDHGDLMRSGDGRPQSMWSFGAQKIREIGLRGIFAGWGLSFTKDSLGSAVFFSMFEYVKAQGYYNFVSWYYGGLQDSIVADLALKRPVGSNLTSAEAATNNSRFHNGFTVIRPHYAIEPGFLLLAGISASFAQQIVVHPLTHIQLEHWDRLEDLDARAQEIKGLRARAEAVAVPTLRETATNTGSKPGSKILAATATLEESSVPKAEKAQASIKSPPRGLMLQANYRAYQETWRQCVGQARAEKKGILSWLYRGFWWNTIRQVPSTSAGLIIFELVRRKYGMDNEKVRIQHDDYEILLN